MLRHNLQTIYFSFFCWAYYTEAPCRLLFSFIIDVSDIQHSSVLLLSKVLITRLAHGQSTELIYQTKIKTFMSTNHFTTGLCLSTCLHICLSVYLSVSVYQIDRQTDRQTSVWLPICQFVVAGLLCCLTLGRLPIRLPFTSAFSFRILTYCLTLTFYFLALKPRLRKGCCHVFALMPRYHSGPPIWEHLYNLYPLLTVCFCMSCHVESVWHFFTYYILVQ